MLIEWKVSDEGIAADQGHWHAWVFDHGAGWQVQVFDVSSKLMSKVTEKTCNNLIEALHWAEDELKFLSKGDKGE